MVGCPQSVRPESRRCSHFQKTLGVEVSEPHIAPFPRRTAPTVRPRWVQRSSSQEYRSPRWVFLPTSATRSWTWKGSSVLQAHPCGHCPEMAGSATATWEKSTWKSWWLARPPGESGTSKGAARVRGAARLRVQARGWVLLLDGCSAASVLRRLSGNPACWTSLRKSNDFRLSRPGQTTEIRIWRHFRWSAEIRIWPHFHWSAFVTVDA